MSHETPFVPGDPAVIVHWPTISNAILDTEIESVDEETGAIRTVSGHEFAADRTRTIPGPEGAGYDLLHPDDPIVAQARARAAGDGQ